MRRLWEKGSQGVSHVVPVTEIVLGQQDPGLPLCGGVPLRPPSLGLSTPGAHVGRRPSSLLWFAPGVPKYRQAKSREERLSFVEHLLCARHSTLTPDQSSSG